MPMMKEPDVESMFDYILRMSLSSDNGLLPDSWAIATPV